jgi:hypothetical protein
MEARADESTKHGRQNAYKDKQINVVKTFKTRP